MTFKIKFVTDGSHRSVMENYPATTSSSNDISSPLPVPGFSFEVSTIDPLYPTKLAAPGDRGVMLWGHQEKVLALMDSGEILFFGEGDELKVTDLGLPTGSTWMLEIYHDTTMWNEGFDKASTPFMVVPLKSKDALDEAQAWVKGNFSLSVMPDYIGFLTKHTKVDGIEPIGRKAAKQLIESNQLSPFFFSKAAKFTLV